MNDSLQLYRGHKKEEKRQAGVVKKKKNLCGKIKRAFQKRRAEGDLRTVQRETAEFSSSGSSFTSRVNAALPTKVESRGFFCSPERSRGRGPFGTVTLQAM